MKLSLSQVVIGLQPNLSALFGPYLSSNSQIILPTAPDYPAQIQPRWSNYNAPSFNLGAIKPATETDVQKIVQIASENKLPFFTIGGGHGTSDHHSFTGMAIDMSAFKSISFDKDGSHMTIGGSVKIKDIIKPLYKARKELPLGACACVGVVGATLGGGIGGLHGHRGLMLDSLESVRIVTANGDLLQSSVSENEDLFWAVRGAGSNFGIVTSATYSLPEISNNGYYMNADFLLPISANTSFWQALQSFDHNMPSRLSISAAAVYNRVIDEPVLAVNAIFFGPQEEGERYIKPFKDLEPTMSNISMVPADEVMDAAFFNSFGQDNGACTPDQHINIYTSILKQVHTPTFESFFSKLVNFWQANPEFQGRFLMQRYASDGPLATPTSATAYGHRDAKLFLLLEGWYEDRDLDDTVNEFWDSARKELARTSGYTQPSVYVNYARGDEGPVAWYGNENLARLSALKRKYDPEELFSVNNPVPLHWSDEESNHSDL